MEYLVYEFMQLQPLMCLEGDIVAGIAIWMDVYNQPIVLVIDNYQSRKPIGVVTLEDIETKVTQLKHDPKTVRVRDIMSSPVVSVLDNDTIARAKAIMVSYGKSRVAVLDNTGKCVGLLYREAIHS